jgi:drug/metabolite transporter (DMT)-like permease
MTRPVPVAVAWQGWAVLALLLNAATWGLSWWPFRQLNAAGLHPLWITAFVYLIACLAIVLWRPRALGLLLREPALWAILLASGLTNATFNWAVTVGEVTRVVLLFYLTPLWTVALARWWLGEAVTPAVLLRVALALTGAALVLTSQPGGAAAHHPALLRFGADALGLLGGLCFATTNVLLRREAAQPEEGRALAMFAGGVLVAGGVAALAAALTAGQAELGVARVPWPPAGPGAGPCQPRRWRSDS